MAHHGERQRTHLKNAAPCPNKPGHHFDPWTYIAETLARARAGLRHSMILVVARSIGEVNGSY